MDWADYIFICHLGGKFDATEDGSLIYVGGDAHAINFKSTINFRSTYYFRDFKKEVAEVFNCNVDKISEFKYLYPGRKTLITISNDKDLEVMKRVHAANNDKDLKVIKKAYLNLAPIDIYVITA